MGYYEMGDHSIQKIYIVSWFGCSNTGGVERVVQYMVNAWKDMYDIEVIDLKKIKRLCRYGCLLGLYHGIDSLIVSIYMRQLTRNGKKLVITNGYNCPYVRADMLFMHGTMRGYKVACDGNRAKLWQISQLYEQAACKRAKKILCVSQNAAEEVQRYYGASADKIEVLENCVDTDIFYPDNRLRRNREVINIIYCGTLEYRKGVDILLKHAKIIEKYDNMRLLIATQKSKNTEMFSGLKNTTIYKSLHVKDMNLFYNQGDMMLFPSRYEGFEMVTTECMAAGVPVMGNNIGAIGHLYNKGIEGVFLLSSSEEKNIACICEQVQIFGSDDKKRMLHENMEKMFGLKQYKEKLKNIVKCMTE